MKKYLILLIIPLLFFSTGCEDEADRIQNTTLDANLYGVWTLTESDGDVYYHSFSNNGKWGYSRNGIVYFTGDWWVEGIFIWIDVDDSTDGFMYIYSFPDENTLIIDGVHWSRVS